MYKFLGARATKIWEGKNLKILRDFEQFWILITNVLEIDWDIRNREQTRSRVIYAGFSKKIVKFGPLTEKVIGVDVDLPWVDNARSAYANAFEFGHVTATWGISSFP